MRTDPSRETEIPGSKSRSYDNSFSQHPTAGDLPFPVPGSVLPEIIPIPEAKFDISYISAQRDRRLRLLIRRYTNQIQYGCRNVNCASPTCFSYRRRNSKTPLRRYNDLAARSLACRLVEDLTVHEQDPTSGLCCNEPVVPWYEDSRQKHQHSRGRSDVPELSNRRNEKLRSVDAVASGHIQSLRNNEADGTRRQSWPRSTIQEKTTLEHENTKLPSKEITDDTGSFEKQDFNPDDISPAETTPPTPKKDFASLIQCLYDLRPLRMLSWLPKSELGQVEEVPDLENPYPPSSSLPSSHHEQDVKTNTKQSPAPQEHFQGTTYCGYTLNRLRWDTLSWLKSFQSENLDTNAAFNTFLHQSLFYCLGDPKRLLHSVKTWTHPADLKDSLLHKQYDRLWSDIFKTQMEQQTLDDLKRELSDITKRTKPLAVATDNTINLFGTISAFSRIVQFKKQNEMLDALFNSVQQSFLHPSAPQFSRRHKFLQSKCNHIDPTTHSPIEKNEIQDHAMSYSNGLRKRGPTDTRKSVDKICSLSEEEVSTICLLSLLACVSVVFAEKAYLGNKPAIVELSKLRNTRNVYPRFSTWHVVRNLDKSKQRQIAQTMIGTIDLCEDWYVLRLVSSTMNLISHQLAVSEMQKSQNGIKVKGTLNVIERMMRVIGNSPSEPSIDGSVPMAIIELLRTIMLNLWDGKPIVHRNTAVGGTLEVLAEFYRQRKQLNLEAPTFFMPFMSDAFDAIEMPSEWINFRSDGLQTHVLSFSFLFEPATLVKYFRAINIEIMRKCHENAFMHFNSARQFLTSSTIPIYGGKEVLATIRPQIAQYFVLTIRRDNVLADAINQIWRRQRRELMRPLRVRLGKDEGEDGLDHGGVQQEFFRVVFAQALHPEYGMFCVDDRTRMTWFQPDSPEPLYKYEAMGILMSLAVYNAVTLPITFPLAFYRKLLGLKVKKLHHIADGWPDLVRGLEVLLSWSDGDVSDAIGRTYEFSYEAFGSTTTIDMQRPNRDVRWLDGEGSKRGKEKANTTSLELQIDPQFTPPVQSSPALTPLHAINHKRAPSIDIKGVSTPLSMESDVAGEVSLVTNANRESYVKDYIYWLTDKSIRPQYEAFAQGFYTCLDRTALSLFNAQALKDVVEGHSEIDIDEWERTTTYDDFEQTSETIVNFWQVVKSFSPEQHRKLLEFVTASSRIPVNGMTSVQFTVQKNGEDDARLPSSSTCYGRLLLPQYSSRAILEEKLSKAIENSIGFGAL